jgi:hypothetical protein
MHIYVCTEFHLILKLCWLPDDGRKRPKHVGVYKSKVAVLDGIVKDLFLNVSQTQWDTLH